MINNNFSLEGKKRGRKLSQDEVKALPIGSYVIVEYGSVPDEIHVLSDRYGALTLRDYDDRYYSCSSIDNCLSVYEIEEQKQVIKTGNSKYKVGDLIRITPKSFWMEGEVFKITEIQYDEDYDKNVYRLSLCDNMKYKLTDTDLKRVISLTWCEEEFELYNEKEETMPLKVELVLDSKNTVFMIKDKDNKVTQKGICKLYHEDAYNSVYGVALAYARATDNVEEFNRILGEESLRTLRDYTNDELLQELSRRLEK